VAGTVAFVAETISIDQGKTQTAPILARASSILNDVELIEAGLLHAALSFRRPIRRCA
jgi:hypothetical protein